MIRYEDISAAIQVRHLQVEIAEALTFDLGDRADLAAAAMASRGFDQAPVVDGDRVLGRHRRHNREGDLQRCHQARRSDRYD